MNEKFDRNNDFSKGSLKVLLLSFMDFDNPYGSHIRPYNLTNYLSKDFAIIAVCGKGKNKLTNYHFEERKWVRFRSNKAMRYLFGLLDTFKLIKRYNPDLIYAHGYTFGFLSTTVVKLSKLKLIKKAPIILDLHGSAVFEQINNRPNDVSPIVLSMLERQSVLRSDRIICACEEIKKFISEFYGVNLTKITPIFNGVSRTNFYQLPLLTRYELRRQFHLQNKKVIVLVAPRESTKPFDWSVQAINIMYKAMSELSKIRNDIILRIIGGGPILPNAPKNVTYLSFIEELNLELNRADFAIVPYPDHLVCGGARNKVLEFFACRLPILSTKSGIFGIPEAKAFENYVPIDYSVEDIVHKILLVIDMKEEELDKITENAFQLIVSKYDWEKSSQNLEKTFVLFAKTMKIKC